eukprot:9137325-Lingulodinium_polyedra.AAC.1
MVQACSVAGVYFSIENPASSGIWHYAPLRRALRAAGAAEAPLTCCAYGAPFKKPSLRVGTIPGMQSLARAC